MDDERHAAGLNMCGREFLFFACHKAKLHLVLYDEAWILLP